MAQLDLKSPAVQRGILFVLAGISLLAVFFFTHFVPFGYQNQKAKIVTLKAEYEKKATELSRARATVADLPRFEAEYAQLHERWARVAEQLPTERQLPVLMRKITLAAQQNGVGFMAFRPQGAKAEQHYTETPIALSIFGNYHQVGSFLADLANMPRIITVSGLVVKTNTRVRNIAATTTADLTASAYHLTTTSSAQPEAPAPGTPAPAKKEEGPDAHKEG
jgi:type IV pilus assembly protein PilO